MNCDLHTHSTYSDGSCSPLEIIELAKESDLTVALTDHNTVAGVAEFLLHAAKMGVNAVPGVEISTSYKGAEFHLLGLFIPFEHYVTVENFCKEFHAEKEISNIQTVKNLSAAGYVMDYSSVKNHAKNGNVNRAHIALELVEKGYVKTVKEAFCTLLSPTYGFYTQIEHKNTVDAIKMLKSIKAVPVLAHPLKDVSKEFLRDALPSLVEAGLVGMEVYHPSYDDEKTRVAMEIAEKFDLLPSGGSDFHGVNKPGISLGKGKGNLAIPIGFYEDLLMFSEKMHNV